MVFFFLPFFLEFCLPFSIRVLSLLYQSFFVEVLFSFIIGFSYFVLTICRRDFLYFFKSFVGGEVLIFGDFIQKNKRTKRKQKLKLKLKRQQSLGSFRIVSYISCQISRHIMHTCKLLAHMKTLSNFTIWLVTIKMFSKFEEKVTSISKWWPFTYTFNF